MEEKVSLRKGILSRIHEYQDTALVKELFMFLVNQPDEIILTQELPELDVESFKEVLHEVLFETSEIKKTCLDALLNLLLRTPEYRSALKPKLCQLVLRLCEEPDLRILKPCDEKHQTESSELL